MDINNLTLEELKIVKDAINQKINQLGDNTSQEETLEEAAEKYSDNWEEITGLDYDEQIPSFVNKLDFIEGAKWQAKRMYSEEDLEQAFSSGRTVKNYKGEWEETYSDEMTSSKYENFKKWFEQFKNK
jgi:hypothetical protein